MNVYFNVHTEVAGGEPEPRCREGDRLIGIARDGNADQPPIADDAVGRVEFNLT